MAICEVFVPKVAVGAEGTPSRDGDVATTTTPPVPVWPVSGVLPLRVIDGVVMLVVTVTVPVNVGDARGAAPVTWATA